MARALRWTEKELAQHLGRAKGPMSVLNVPTAPSKPSTTPAPQVRRSHALQATTHAKATTRTQTADRPRKSLGSRAKDAANSLKLSRISGRHQAGQFLEFTLDGARLLSVNELYALHHFQRIAYRKAWHEAVQAAVLVVTGGPRHWLKFDRFTVIVHRRSRSGCDVDALNGYFKYAIDGLRYTGLIADDDPTHMLSMVSTQEKGQPLVRIRVECAPQTIEEGNLRLTGAQAGAIPNTWSGLQQGAEPDRNDRTTPPEGAGGG